MQVLKEEVRQRIIKSAKKEFKNNGFDKASMRDIADSARMTVGNLYRYYKNKEDMFGAIVGSLFQDIKNLRRDIPQDQEGNVGFILNRLVELQRDNKSEWLILFNTNRGTKYARAVEDVYALLTEALIANFNGKDGFDETIAKPIAHAIINGLNTILQNERKFNDDAADLFLNYMIQGSVTA
jgi:AcrR family transcriptional regulator